MLEDVQKCENIRTLSSNDGEHDMNTLWAVTCNRKRPATTSDVDSISVSCCNTKTDLVNSAQPCSSVQQSTSLQCLIYQSTHLVSQSCNISTDKDPV